MYKSSNYNRRRRDDGSSYVSELRDIARNSRHEDVVPRLMQATEKSFKIRRWSATDDNIIQYILTTITKDRVLPKLLCKHIVPLANKFPRQSSSSRYTATVV